MQSRVSAITILATRSTVMRASATGQVRIQGIVFILD